MSLRIRNNLERVDWTFIREVCCLTGNAGDPIDRARWPFFGEQWVGPYERLHPEWAYVAEDAERRLGYLTGCADSVRGQTEKAWLFDLPLFLRSFLGTYPVNDDVRNFRRRFIAGLTRRRENLGPRDHFPREATRQIVAEYPAHLHMNLVDEARGKGVGRQLVDRFREDLVGVGVRGIHLYCGEKPRPFYERVGFRVLDQIEFRPGFDVYRLGSRF